MADYSVFAGVAALWLTSTLHAYSPALNDDFPTQVYWGDTHLHSSLSADANNIGNTALPPSEAYRFARGETVTGNSDLKARLNRPLDFLVIADHAAYLGVLPEERRKGADRQRVKTLGMRFFKDIMGFGEGAEADIADIVGATWKASIEAADAANDPGNFTALAGFEWSSMPGGDNLHRVVVFRDGSDKTGQVRPFSVLDSLDPRDLWDYLAGYEAKTGGQVLAIPHNGNVSNGRMFANLVDGKSMSAAYAQKRARWEPVYEVTQIKGDGEAHPFLSPNDEFADFGTWDTGNLGTTQFKEPEMLQFEYARSALKLGLAEEARLGSNPFQFGMIGSTDAHTSLATAEEDNFWGKAANYEPGQKRSEGNFMLFRKKGSVVDSASGEGSTWVNYTPQPGDVPVHTWEQLAAGYAAVWARENTREAIFDALQRREVYATTGPRMTVRFFAGWDFQPDDVYRPDFVRHAYSKGVPMGAELKPAAKHRAPRFLVTALKDAEGANLDRVQIVKGWQDENGQLQEKVYNVAWAGKRILDRRGKLSAVGSTVDLKNARYLNTIGAAELSTVWEDPDFDPAERAFYYVRVLEIPTPRWVAYDEAHLGSRFPEDAKRVHQERAYTSPIWYSPSE